MALYGPDSFLPCNSLGFLAKRVSQLTLALLEPVFEEEAITYTQWVTLVSLWSGRASTCADLAREASHDRGAMTRLIDQMEERGWLRRERDRQDRRVVNVALTQEGHEVADRCRGRVIDAWNDWMRDWPEDEARALIAGMQRLVATLEMREGLTR